MATYNQVSYGSSGSSVTELQKLLNQNGYNLVEDGQFGSKTQAAVKDYQQKNGLAVDGIVGTNTWGALTKASASATPTTPETTAPEATTPDATAPETTDPTTAEADTGFNYGEYTPSDAVQQAQQLLDQHQALLLLIPSSFLTSLQMMSVEFPSPLIK